MNSFLPIGTPIAERLFDPEDFMKNSDMIETFDADGNVTQIQEVPERYKPSFIDRSMMQVLSRLQLPLQNGGGSGSGGGGSGGGGAVFNEKLFLDFLSYLNTNPTSELAKKTAAVLSSLLLTTTQPPPSSSYEASSSSSSSDSSSDSSSSRRRCHRRRRRRCEQEEEEDIDRLIVGNSVLLVSGKFLGEVYISASNLVQILKKSSPVPSDFFELKFVIRKKISPPAVSIVKIEVVLENTLSGEDSPIKTEVLKSIVEEDLSSSNSSTSFFKEFTVNIPVTSVILSGDSTFSQRIRTRVSTEVAATAAAEFTAYIVGMRVAAAAD